MNEIKEWVKATHAATNVTIVTVTLSDGNLTAKWSARTFFPGGIKAGVAKARAGAHGALADLKAALEELDA